MPSDYAAFAYDMMPTVGAFFEGTDMASSILQQKHLSFINSVYEYTVTASSTVSLFLDVNQVVSCYDGTMTAPVPGTMLGNSTSSGLIYPMGANMTYGTTGYIDRTVIFDWSAPQFGFSSWTLPVFVGVGEGGDASAVGETYAFATSLADLPRPGRGLEPRGGRHAHVERRRRRGPAAGHARARQLDGLSCAVRGDGRVLRLCARRRQHLDIP